MAIDYSGTNTNLNTQRANKNDIRQANYDLNPTDSQSNNLLQTSTNIFIYANDSLVGMIQSLTVNETRGVDKLQAIGYEGVVQAVPQNTNGGTLNVTRMALYESSMWNALAITSSGKGYNPIGSKVHNSSTGKDDITYDADSSMAISRNSTQIFKTLRDQRTPFEIKIKTRRSGVSGSINGGDYYIETYIDCWLQSYAKTYSVGQITVSEQATISYADVY